jgi:hypothetical protein
MSTDPLGPLSALPGVAEAVSTSRSTVDALTARLNNRVLRRRAADVSAESVLRGAWASAVLDGSTASLDDVRSGATLDPVVQGALRVYGELAPLATTWPTAQRQVLARLHQLAASDLLVDGGRERLGRPRRDPDVTGRLDTLADVLGWTRAPALVVAAVVQAEVLSLDAFPPVSGIVARAAARLTLIARGLDPRSLVVFEAGHLALRDEMAQALAAYSSGGEAGVVRWIRHCGDAVDRGVAEGLEICDGIQAGAAG